MNQKPNTNGPAPSHGPHPPTFYKPPPLSDFPLSGACGGGSSAATDETPDPTKVVLGFIFNAIAAGGTLILTGPNSCISPHDRLYGATLEDSQGERCANAYGHNLGETLVALVSEWHRATELAAHQKEHDRGEE